MAKRDYKKTHLGEHELHSEKLMISYGYDPRLSEGAVKPPVFPTSTFVFPTAEERLAVLEGGEAAKVFASGMAAISTTLLALVSHGEVILRSRPLYGGTETLISSILAGMQLRSHGFTNGLLLNDIRQAATNAMALGSVRVIFLETPANPANS